MSISTLEKRRLENIKRNEEFLKSLGIDDVAIPKDVDQHRQPSLTKKRGYDHDDGDEDYQPPPRRSRRLDSNSKTKLDPLEHLRNLPIDEDLLDKLLLLGISEMRARKALYNTGGSIEQAQLWIEQNRNDSRLDEPLGLLNKSINRYKTKVRTHPFQVQWDEPDQRRNHISAAKVRDYILSHNPTHSDQISNKAIQHCVFRINTMSNRALATRAVRISSGAGATSREKMLVFYYALNVAGLYDLAVTTKSALQRCYSISVHNHDNNCDSNSNNNTDTDGDSDTPSNEIRKVTVEDSDVIESKEGKENREDKVSIDNLTTTPLNENNPKRNIHVSQCNKSRNDNYNMSIDTTNATNNNMKSKKDKNKNENKNKSNKSTITVYETTIKKEKNDMKNDNSRYIQNSQNNRRNDKDDKSGVINKYVNSDNSINDKHIEYIKMEVEDDDSQREDSTTVARVTRSGRYNHDKHINDNNHTMKITD